MESQNGGTRDGPRFAKVLKRAEGRELNKTSITPLKFSRAEEHLDNLNGKIVDWLSKNHYSIRSEADAKMHTEVVTALLAEIVNFIGGEFVPKLVPFL